MSYEVMENIFAIEIKKKQIFDTFTDDKITVLINYVADSNDSNCTTINSESYRIL